MRVVAMAIGILVGANAMAAPTIDGTTAVQQHRLARLRAAGHKPGDALVWRVSPSKTVSKATTARDICEFTAPPGEYEVTLIVVSKGSAGETTVEEATVTVVIECAPPAAPPAVPLPKPTAPSPHKAVSRVTFGSAGCTACPIGPRRADGRWDILTAGHCVWKVGQRGTMFLQDGREVVVEVASVDRTSDHAWLTTVADTEDLPFAMLSTGEPKPNQNVWHAGYGVDRPGNTETGYIEGAEDANGQLRFVLSVSSGDSGGPIFLAGDDTVVGCVCCTLEKGARVSMWGASARSAAATRPKVKASGEWHRDDEIKRGVWKDKWTPIEMPMRPLPADVRATE